MHTCIPCGIPKAATSSGRCEKGPCQKHGRRSHQDCWCHSSLRTAARVLLGVRGIRSVHTYIPPPPCHAAEGGALLLFSCACGSDAHCASHTRPHRTQKCAPVRCAIRVEPGGCLQRTTPRAHSAGDMKTVRPERCSERWTHACAAPHSLVVETRPLFLFIGARVRAPRHPRHCPA